MRNLFDVGQGVERGFLHIFEMASGNWP